MNELHIPRFVLAGAYSGAGKTSVSMAVMGALKNMGVFVYPYKVGPDYIDPLFHAFVTGTRSRNLDSWIVEPEELKKLFAETATRKAGGVAVIEGVMGLYDGNGTTDEGSTAHLAKILSAPVVLVASGEGIGRSIGAVASGYRDFDRNVDLAGVIINKVSGERHYRLLKDAIEGEAGIRCYGYLQKKSELALGHRALGLALPGETEEICAIRLQAEKLAQMAAETIDIEGLLETARGAPPMDAAIRRHVPGKGRVRVGVPSDGAFYAYYEDNLDLMRELGTEIVFFDSMKDRALPEGLSGLYIGGGSLEEYAPKISKNAPLMHEIRGLLEKGIPAYAEGAGSAYLCRSLTGRDGRSHPMTGFLMYDAYAAQRLPNFGHITVTLLQDTPLGKKGTEYRANELHRLEIKSANERAAAPAYSARKPSGAKWEGGIARKNTFASLAQLHFYAARDLAANFIEACRRYEIGESDPLPPEYQG